MDSHEHNQFIEPNQLAHRHRRRAHAAAWAAGITGLIGIPTAEAASSQIRADSHVGVATEYETVKQAEQSPQAFIAVVDKKMAVVESRIKSARHLKIIKGSDISANTPADVRVYFTWAPNHTNPHHYDLLTVSVRGNQKTPIFTTVTLGADSNKMGQIKNNPDGSYLDHPQDVHENFLPGTIQLAVSKGPDVRTYCASTTNYDSNHPPFGEQTDLVFDPVSPAVVSGAFNTFFKQADGILAAVTKK